MSRMDFQHDEKEIMEIETKYLLSSSHPWLFDLFTVFEKKFVERRFENDVAYNDGVYIYFTYNFFNYFTFEEKGFILIHELLHCVNMHAFNYKDKDQFFWNLAADLYVNNYLKSLKIFNFEGMNLWFNDNFNGWTAEQIYFYLSGHPDEIPDDIFNGKNKFGSVYGRDLVENSSHYQRNKVATNIMLKMIEIIDNDRADIGILKGLLIDSSDIFK